MRKDKEIKRLAAYLETSITLLSNALWIEPEEIGSIIAECSIEACKGIFGNTNGSTTRIKKDWIEKTREGFTNKLSELINGYD